MKSVYLYWPDSMGSGYAKVLLRKLCSDAGMEVVSDPQRAEAVLVSLCDVSEVHHLIEARKYGRPVVAGGWISYMPFLRFFSDMTCVGEGYDFIAAMGRAGSLADLADLPYVSTPTKQGLINERIEWSSNPIVRIGQNACYYYCGKGCSQKCKFCAMAYSRHLNYAPKEMVLGAARNLPKDGHLFLMVSHLGYTLPPEVERRLGATDVKISNYIKHPINARQVRTGLEFLDPGMRKDLAKPISTEQLQEFFAVTKSQKTESTVYLVAGLESMDLAEQFAATLPIDMDLRPPVHLHFTYIDPQPLTPMADLDIRKKERIDPVRFMALCHTRNRRVRVGTMRQPGYSTWRTLLQRSTTAEQAAWAYSLRTCDDHDRLVAAAEKCHPELLGTATVDEIRSRPRRIVDSAFWTPA